MSATENIEEKIAHEVEEGNVEHKLILRPEPDRLIQLVSQLKWRLKEGNGEALYELGVSDDGYLVGLTFNEMATSLDTLSKMAADLDADTSVVRRVRVDHNKNPTSPLAKRFLDYQSDNSTVVRYAVEVLVRQRTKLLCPEIRILIFGDKNNGKTSLLGVLANGELDDGLGSTRLNILRHFHEIESGHTSSVTQKSIGYSSTGKIVRSEVYWAEGSFEQSILESSSKVVTFIDTSGVQKYSKTVYSGFLGSPNYLCVVVSVLEKGLSQYELELLKMAQIVNDVPAFLVVTKIDLVSQDKINMFLDAVKQQLQLPFIKCLPIVVESEGDVIMSMNKFQTGIIPVFCISNVSGLNMPLLEQFLNILPHHPSFHSNNNGKPLEFQIEEIFIIPDVGSIVGGLILNGSMRVGGVYNLGPLNDGTSMQVVVKSIQRQRSSISELLNGQAGTIHLEPIDKRVFVDNKSKQGIRLRKGMLLLEETPIYTNVINAVVQVITDEGIQGISSKISGRVYIGSLQQNGTIIEQELLREKEYKIKIQLAAKEWTRSGLKLIFYSPSFGLKCAGSIQ